MIFLLFFFFNDTATTEIYTLSLHDALPIYHRRERAAVGGAHLGDRRQAPRAGGPLERRRHQVGLVRDREAAAEDRDRKSTRLNSSHANISYAVFCLKKKKKNN